MVQYRVYINDEELHEDDIFDIKKSSYDLDFAGDKLISNKTEITLANYHYKFDTRKGSKGYFENIDWFNNPVRVVDDRDGSVFFEGRLKNVKLFDRNLTVILYVSDYLQDMTDTVCVIDELDITPADAIYKILTNPDYLNIPEEKIIKGAFDFGAILQADRRVKIGFNVEDNVQCISVIEELCRISCYSKVFLVDNRVSYWVWQPYFGAQGFPVDEIMPGSYSEEVVHDIINEFSIAYQSGTNVLRESGQHEASRAKYGAGKAFLMPDRNVESTLAADYKILYKTSDGAAAVGSEIINRFKDARKVCKFQISDELSFLQLGNDLELKFKPFVREPVRITGIEPNIKQALITATAEFLNYPDVYPVDRNVPEAPEMISAFRIDDDRVAVIWVPFSGEFNSYVLHFSRTTANWDDLLINNQRSPIQILPDGLIDGYFYKILEGFSGGATFYFKMRILGENYLLSEFSNIVKTEYTTAGSANLFRLTGNIYEGLVIDSANPGGGSAPDGWTRYGTALYDEDAYAPAAMYESELLHSPGGFTHIITEGHGDPGDIVLQQRSYSGGVYGPWSTPVDTTGQKLSSITGESVQIRVIFNSPRWTDEDKFIIKEIK